MQIDQRRQKVIPCEDKCEHRADGGDGSAQRQHDMPPNSKPSPAIHFGGFDQGLWNLRNELTVHEDEQATLAVALNSFRNQYGGVNKVNLLMAASLVTMIPCILLFLVAQRQFIEGLGKGAVKG